MDPERDDSSTAEVTDQHSRSTVGTEPKLTDLVDVSLLQQIQDWFARTTGFTAAIRDVGGYLVTEPSGRSRFCELVRSSPEGDRLCRECNIKAAARAAQTGEPVPYTCHAGLTQFAAPIVVAGVRLGTVVLGDRPRMPLTVDEVTRLADELGLDSSALQQAARELEAWSEQDLRAGIELLHVITNTLLGICYQGHRLRSTLSQLHLVHRVSAMMISSAEAGELLSYTVHTIGSVLGVKACSLRLLDEAGKELVVKAVYNVSPTYLKKGPVMVEDSIIDRLAMSGQPVTIQDMTNDPRVLYPDDAKREGLRSGLTVAIMSRGKPIGTIHVYTGEPHEFTTEEIELLQTLGNHAAVAIENARLYQESLRRQRLEEELAWAGRVQARLIPAEAPRVPGFDIAARCLPTSHLGGDFYDFIKIPGPNLGIAIGDVSGSSAPAAILMSGARSALRAHVRSIYDVREIVSAVNRALYEDTSATEFITLFYGVLDYANRVFTYTNAGHFPPLLFRGGEVVELSRGGLTLGISDDVSFEGDRAELKPGDVVVFYTDGVSEQSNPRNELFGVERLKQVASAHLAESATQVLDAIQEALASYQAGTPQSDDRTLIILKAQ